MLCETICVAFAESWMSAGEPWGLTHTRVDSLPLINRVKVFMVKGHDSALPAGGQANEAAPRFPSLSSQEFTLICNVILRITSNVPEVRKNCTELYTSALPVNFSSQHSDRRDPHPSEEGIGYQFSKCFILPG